LIPQTRCEHLAGIPSLLLPLARINEARRKSDDRAIAGMSIPEVANVLQIKQEVAYFLLKKGFLSAHRVVGPKRHEFRVDETQLKRFQGKYVLARDLAKVNGVSPRKMIARLALIGIYPSSGPGADEGRQCIFLRADAIAADLFATAKPVNSGKLNRSDL
jgi:hypothetical protein